MYRERNLLVGFDATDARRPLGQLDVAPARRADRMVRVLADCRVNCS